MARSSLQTSWLTDSAEGSAPGPPNASAAFSGPVRRILGCRDQHGYLRISGRIKEMIIRDGENIYPAEVEATLIDLDAVAEAAMVCVPHPELGEVPVAFIVSRA